MTREHNWSDTHTFTARAIRKPDSIDAVRRLVAEARHVRAVGARHSFNDIADSEGVMIDVGALEEPVVINRADHTVTVPAGMSYGSLAKDLQDAGWALHNMGSLPHITVGGATATGTHGSGDRNGSLATAVAAIELVTATGDLVTVRRGEADFDGIVVGLGAFGVATRITLDIQPSFDVRQDAFVDLRWDTVMADVDAIMSSAYSVSLMTHWSGETVDRLWLKTIAADSSAQAATAEHLGAHAAMHALQNASEENLARFTPFGTVGPWSERLVHFNVGADPGPAEQIQSEYMVPRPQAAAAIGLMRAMAAEIDALLILTEIRSVAADSLWLSSAYGHDVVALHFTWRRERSAVAEITRAIEAKLIPLGARPHWGKLMHAEAGAIAGLYPKLGAFRALAAKYDPAGKFRNAFLDRHVFGTGK